MNALILWFLAAAASSAAPGAQVAEPQPSVQNQAQARYQIGAQDQLKVTVYDADELSGSYRVDADGFITFPLLGRIAVAGVSVAECQDKLRSMLAAGYIRNPQVRVDVEEYKSQSIFVSGEVRSPAEIRMSGAMTLLQALAQAGSPLSSASSELTIARQKRGPGGAPPPPGSPDANEVIKVNGNEATAKSYIVLVRAKGEGALVNGLAGRYEDQLVKQGDRWLFKNRKVHFDLMGDMA